MSEQGAEQRLDSWLWAARFFKTRALARKAVDGGHVEVNGVAAKPARRLAVGDRLDIRNPGGHFTVDVEALSAQRRPAAEARALYEETPESRAARERAAAERRQQRTSVVFDRERPDRRKRRAYIRFHRGED